MLPALNKLLAPIRTRLANMVSRAVVQLVDDGLKLQGLQVTMLDGETRDQLERFQQYGFTSVPLPGAEGIALFMGGRRDHGVVIAVEDRRYRLKGLAPGEVALYHKDGAYVLMKADGSIEVKSTVKVVVDAPLTELAQPAADAALKGTAFNTALGTFLTALGTYIAAIQAVADPPGTVTTTFATATTTFGTAATSALSAKVKIG